MYQWYFKKVLPTVGQAISRSRDKAYHYLPASVQDFPDGDALANRLREHGLIDVTWRPFTFGIASLYVGTKPFDCQSSRG
jgi:demethylmenaquinone methyltransferase/2-methoxy-6-polyprenyl-1,4-benzoquinol methylase